MVIKPCHICFVWVVKNILHKLCKIKYMILTSILLFTELNDREEFAYKHVILDTN